MWLQEVLVVFFAHASNVTTWAFQGIAAWIPCSPENRYTSFNKLDEASPPVVTKNVLQFPLFRFSYV